MVVALEEDKNKKVTEKIVSEEDKNKKVTEKIV